MIVYLIRNKINGKKYIGQTIQPLKYRWSSHCKPSENRCTWLKAAIKKYGKENFEVKILVRCSSLKEMNHREEYYIKLFGTLAPNGYNLKAGGDNKLYSEESKKKMSLTRKGRPSPNKGKKKEPTTEKSIICVETQEVFKSIRIAAKKLNILETCICAVLKGRQKTAGKLLKKKLTFEYINPGTVR